MSFLDIDERLFTLLEHIEFDRSPLTDIKTCSPDCDIGIIEGGLCNAENVHVLREFRKNCKILIAMGACAINGGLPARRNHCRCHHHRRGSITQPGADQRHDPERPGTAAALDQVHRSTRWSGRLLHPRLPATPATRSGKC